MNYIDSRRAWSHSYWSQWQDFHETWHMLTIQLIAPQKAMKISSGRRQARETRCADSAAGLFLRWAPALKPITAPKRCFGSRDQQRGGGVVAVLLSPGDPWQLPAKGWLFPRHQGFQLGGQLCPPLPPRHSSPRTRSRLCRQREVHCQPAAPHGLPPSLPSPFQRQIKLIWCPVPAAGDTRLLRLEADLTARYGVHWSG